MKHWTLQSRMLQPGASGAEQTNVRVVLLTDTPARKARGRRTKRRSEGGGLRSQPCMHVDELPVLHGGYWMLPEPWRRDRRLEPTGHPRTPRRPRLAVTAVTW